MIKMHALRLVNTCSLKCDDAVNLEFEFKKALKIFDTKIRNQGEKSNGTILFHNFWLSSLVELFDKKFLENLRYIWRLVCADICFYSLSEKMINL